jgi:hypothetical protein
MNLNFSCSEKMPVPSTEPTESFINMHIYTLWYIDMVDMMESAEEVDSVEGRVAEQGLPEKEPETIGEALKKYYEEQLSHADGVKVETGRKALLVQMLAAHSMALN